MADFKFPKFNAADSKSRVFIVLLAIVGISIVGYVGVKYFGGGATASGPSRVANPAANLQSVPGSQLTPQYYQALKQANIQASQQASMTGGSAVPTLVNVPGSGFGGSGNCTVMCGDENVNVANDVDDLVKQGKLSQEDADKLNALATANVPVSQYAASLDELVREGKLTPEQARKLLEDYKKQHTNALANESAQAMDAMIKSGQVPLGVANDLLALQKKNVSPAEYAAELARLVREGKISPAVAAQLLAQYTQQQQKELAKQNAFQLDQMAKNGEITADVAKDLSALQSSNVPVDQYAAELDRLVKEGKLTPAAAAKLLAQYRQQRLAIATAGTLGGLLSEGGAKADEAKRLLNMQANNATLQAYADELKRAVQAGLITPEMAAQLLEEYKASVIPFAPAGGLAAGASASLPGAADFAKLQQQLQREQVTPAAVSGPTQFTAVQSQSDVEARRAEQQRIQDMEAAMSGQAQQLITAWQPLIMQHIGGSVSLEKEKTSLAGGSSTSTTLSKEITSSTGAPSIKAGTIFFAILDTGVNSDYPDTPVMATIVTGPFKGAKLIGKVQVGQGPNQEKVSLTFSLMSMDVWPTNKSITAFAIDPDTARTVMASDVDHHYATRYGAVMATSFLSGYASAITSAGSTSTTGVFGTSTTHPELSPASKLAVGLGQIGTNLSTVAQTYTSIPTTITVNAGVGLGILFMSDVPQ